MTATVAPKKLSLAIPAGLDPTIQSIAEEVHRIHEAAMWSGQGQFEQTKIWRMMNAVLGVPAASLAALAGGTGLASSHRVGYAAVMALAAAAFSAALTTLNDKFVYKIPGPATGAAYIESAPREHLKYVNDSNELPTRGCAKRLARFIKAWKYYCNVPISSFYLEMRCAQHARAQSTYIDVWDVCQVLESMKASQLAAMNDPLGLSGRFEACSSDAKRVDALSKLGTAATRARKALDAQRAGDDVTAFYYLDLLFGGNFPGRY